MAPVFWADPGIAQSPGDLRDVPYFNQVDRVTDEVTNPKIRADARSLFPFFDGATNRLPERPADFANPTPESFLNWHSAHQLEYLRANPLSAYANTPPYNGNPDFAAVYDFPAVRIPAGNPLGSGPGLYAILSADGNEVIVINQLRPDSIAQLGGFSPGSGAASDTQVYSAENQRRLRLMPAFIELVARPFNLLPSTVDPATITLAQATNNAARTSVQAIVNNAINLIRGLPGFTPTTAAEFAADITLRQSRYHYLFTDQLDILNARLDRMEIFNPDEITSRVTTLLDRFERLEAFKSITRPTPNADYTPAGAVSAVNSTDGLVGVDAAARVFIGAEMRLADIARATEGIATTQQYQGRTLDAPTLTFLLQSFANYTNEAEAEAEAEDLKQHNQLLQDYSKFQTILNQTLQAYDPVRLAASRGDSDDSDDPELLSIKGDRYRRADGATPIFDPYNRLGDFTAAEQVIISMFDRSLATDNGNSFHPVETLKNLDRPLEAIVQPPVTGVGNLVTPGGALFREDKNTWDKMAVNVAEMTKLIGQDTQIRMNEINQINKQKNRHYELASSALNRMSGILRSITEA
jgi:hypothetical protein